MPDAPIAHGHVARRRLGPRGGRRRSGDQGILGEALRYYPDSDRWVSAGSTVPRKFHAAARLGADVIVAGGETFGGATNGGAILGGSGDEQPNPDTVQRYDPVANDWSRAPNLLRGGRSSSSSRSIRHIYWRWAASPTDYDALATSELFTAGALGQASSDPESVCRVTLRTGFVAHGLWGACHWCNDPTAPGTCQLSWLARHAHQNGCTSTYSAPWRAIAPRCGASSPCEAGYLLRRERGHARPRSNRHQGAMRAPSRADGKPCVDGFCCDSACDGSCEACNQWGFRG